MSAINRRHGLPVTVQAAVSIDQGSTWHRHQLGTPFDLEHVKSLDQVFVGDYQALTATATGFEAVYVRTKPHARPNQTGVFAQAIRVNP
jgi:hypothetical protein